MADHDLPLAERWATLINELGAHGHSGAAEVGTDLVQRYADPQRHYHSVAHLTAVLRVLDELAEAHEPTTATRLAAWFHDAIYDPTAPDNEEQSAALATERLTDLGVAETTTALVAALVLATKHHDPGELPEGDLLLDADLSILGTDEATYRRFSEGVRAEYAHVPDELYVVGRSMVLQSFLDRDRIFLTAAGRQRFEESARSNLAAELALLTAG